NNSHQSTNIEDINSIHLSGAAIYACLYVTITATDSKFVQVYSIQYFMGSGFSNSSRQSKKAYLLIDFSDHLQISVYVLGAVFLQLCQVLQLAEHPVVQKLVDPSLFIHHFTKLLLGRRNNDVSDTALCIVASMKRDWMQTGRKPSGLCGAALYIAALSHGCNYTKADIVSVVHVCEATLTKRLIEFENTDSGSLTVFLLRCEHAYIFMPLCYIEEFLATTDESNEEPVSKHSPKSGEIICKHKDKGFEHFAHGLCEKCYNKFTKLSGGLEGGSVPPAFQRAEKKRLEAAKRAEEAAAAKEAALEKSLCDTQNSEVESAMTPRKGLSGDKSSKMGSEGLINDSMPPKDPEEGGENCEGNADPESLSDIDDAEVDGYLHNEEETQYKKIIWEEMNKEYLEEQADKEALAAELAARGIDPEAGKKKRKRNEDTKSSTPAETPAEATCNMLKRKGLGSKINVGAVDELYKGYRGERRNLPDVFAVQRNMTEKGRPVAVVRTESGEGLLGLSLPHPTHDKPQPPPEGRLPDATK
ncbi:hypothetical protein ACJX0J_021337, partial [Zea mays]